MEKCLNMNPFRRPSINEVVSILEAWERQMYGGDLCLPGGEDIPILYCISTSQSSINAQFLLRRFKKIVEKRDLVTDLCIMELIHGLGNNADIDTPQLFVQGKHVKDFNEIEKLYGMGKLAENLGLPHPLFICDTRQEKKACSACKQIQRYIHCSNCGALNLVWRQWAGRLRICHECNTDQLICDAVTFICYPSASSDPDYMYVIPGIIDF